MPWPPRWWTKTINFSLAPFVRAPAIVYCSIVYICVPRDWSETIVHSLVSSHLDYCNSPPFGIPNYQTGRLQRPFNTAARLIIGIPKFDHISPALFHLHWLPVAFRVHFKLFLLF